MVLKVLMVGPLPTPKTGGVATAVFNLCRYLAKLENVEVFLFADNIFCEGLKDWCVDTDGYTVYRRIHPTIRNAKKYIKLFGLWPVMKTYAGAKWRRYRDKRWTTDIFSYRYSLDYLYLRKIIERVQPDIIHAHHAHDRPICAWLASDGKIPIVTTLHSFNSLLWRTPEEKTCVLSVFRKNFGLAKGLIAVSESVRYQAIELGSDSDKVEVIPNGIDPKRFYMMGKFKIRDELGISSEDKIILFVGNLQRHKGVDVLIKAFIRVNQRRGLERAQLVIVGDGEERLKLENLVNESGLNGKVMFVGQILYLDLDLLRWYNACDLFVSTPSYETQGIVFLEAMSCAKPCIGSNVGGIPMMIKGGETGFLVEYGDITDLADKIEILLRDRELSGEIGRNAREFALKHFSWDHIAQRTHDLYLDIVEHRGRR